MDKEKYKKIVDLIINNNLPIIKQLIADYENPSSRATAGKSLVMLDGLLLGSCFIVFGFFLFMVSIKLSLTFWQYLTLAGSISKLL